MGSGILDGAVTGAKQAGSFASNKLEETGVTSTVKQGYDQTKVVGAGILGGVVTGAKQAGSFASSKLEETGVTGKVKEGASFLS